MGIKQLKMNLGVCLLRGKGREGKEIGKEKGGEGRGREEKERREIVLIKYVLFKF